MQITVEFIRQYFQSFHRNTQEYPKHIPAALSLLFEKEGQLHIILTKRTDNVKHHKEQVSFPGGTIDNVDATIIDTALRETGEEIGLMRNAVEVLGMLDNFCTPSGCCITPIVGFLPLVSSFIQNKTEVSEIFDVPISFFLDSRNERIKRRERSGKMEIMYFYGYSKNEIWGATAEILRTFLNALNTETNHKKTL
jgi:8-oxo-dGTP pyrophosphatase MutT (NUDIX family)